MKSLKPLLVFLALILFPTCEKQQDYYTPEVECRSDWLTNPYYHQPVAKIPAVTNSPDAMTGVISGVKWKSESSPWGYHYKSVTRVSGLYNSMKIVVNYIKGSPAESDFYVMKGNTYFSYAVREGNITSFSIDTVARIINMQFNTRMIYRDVNSNDYDTIIVESGKVTNLKYADQFGRPEYVLQKADSAFGGYWNLIEICDCSAGKVYYPPHESSFFIDFDTVKYSSGSSQSYPYHYPVLAGAWNDSQFSYDFINDSTIVTSTGGATQVGTTLEEQDYFSMFYHLIEGRTLTVKKNKNLLELITEENVYLRFFK